MSRKSKFPLIAGGAVLIITIAIVAAFQAGQKSPLYAAGKIQISQELEPSAKGMRTVYIVALPADGGRMPLGAARFRVSDDARGEFIQFALTPETMTMMPGAISNTNGGAPGLPDKFIIKARLDADGAGGMDQQGDLVGFARDVALGSRDISITIDQAVQ